MCMMIMKRRMSAAVGASLAPGGAPIKEMTVAEQERFKDELKKRALQQMAERELAIAKKNKHRVQEAWLKIMRASKTKELKKELDVLAQTHERNVDRKEAVIQMLNRDLDEAEEQQQVAVRSHMLNVNELEEIQKARMSALEREFQEDLMALKAEFTDERKKLEEQHSQTVRELETLIALVDADQAEKMSVETNSFNTDYEVIHTRTMEEDTQVQFKLDTLIANIKEKCSQTLQTYKQQTDARTNLYRRTLSEDDQQARVVDRDLRRHKKLQDDLARWRDRLKQDGIQAAAKNEGLIKERDILLEHFHALKEELRRKRDTQHLKLASLAKTARECQNVLKEQLQLAEKIVSTAQLCRKLETEREKVCPLYNETALDPDALQFASLEDARLRKDALQEATSTSKGATPPEDMQLDNFFKRFNKVLLDKVALDSERNRLERENAHLRSVLKQFLEGVSVNPDLMDRPNSLVIVNGRSNLNFPLPRVQPGETINTMEAQHVYATRLK